MPFRDRYENGVHSKYDNWLVCRAVPQVQLDVRSSAQYSSERAEPTVQLEPVVSRGRRGANVGHEAAEANGAQ